MPSSRVIGWVEQRRKEVNQGPYGFEERAIPEEEMSLRDQIEDTWRELGAMQEQLKRLRAKERESGCRLYGGHEPVYDDLVVSAHRF